MKELEKYVEKYWWVALVALALVMLKDTSAIIFAAVVGLVVWARTIKFKKNVNFLLDTSDQWPVNYKGKWYSRDEKGDIYKVKSSTN